MILHRSTARTRAARLTRVTRTLVPALALAATLAATITATGAALSATPAAAQDESQRRDEFRWQGQIAAGQSVEVRGINGPIHAAPSTSGKVDILAVKTARTSDPRQVRILVVPHAGGVTICAVYPDVDGEPNTCQPGGGHNNSRDNDVKVEFTVGIPAGAPFIGHSVNGGIDARDLDAQASLHTVNGSINLTTAGHADAKTVNGSITARLGRADWQDELLLKTVNGSIELFLPAGADADLQAKTVNGKIKSELPVTVHELSRRSLHGTIGNGGRTLTIETVNGSIDLRTGG
jgi:hypothetical protein